GALLLARGPRHRRHRPPGPRPLPARRARRASVTAGAIYEVSPGTLTCWLPRPDGQSMRRLAYGVLAVAAALALLGVVLYVSGAAACRSPAVLPPSSPAASSRSPAARSSFRRFSSAASGRMPSFGDLPSGRSRRWDSSTSI